MSAPPWMTTTGRGAWRNGHRVMVRMNVSAPVRVLSATEAETLLEVFRFISERVWREGDEGVIAMLGHAIAEARRYE